METSRQNHRSLKNYPYLRAVSWRSLHLTNPWVLGVIAIRVAAALYMLKDPLWGFIWTGVFDLLDWQILKRNTPYTAGMYQELDKPLDWVGYIVEYYIAWSLGFGAVSTILFAHRFIGQLLYNKTNNRIWFILFPSLFEVAFFWYVVLPYAGISPAVLAEHWVWLWYLVIGKITQEGIVHWIIPRYYIWNIKRGKLHFRLP